MHADYRLPVDEIVLKKLISEENWAEAYDLLAQPLHAWLFHKQDFASLAERTNLEQLILSFDYVQSQVGQGGFIQLVQNGYAPLLVTVIEAMQALNLAAPMAKTLDDALKVMVLNRDELGHERTVEEFGKLYEEFKEFETLENDFDNECPDTLKSITEHAAG
jgi:hypothetical protein